MKKRVPFMDLSSAIMDEKDLYLAMFEQVMDSTGFINSPLVEKFENEFAGYAGINYCAGCSSGTDAIYLALKALGIGPGQKVVTVPNTFFATVEAIYEAGAEPLFVDCCNDTFLMDPEKLETLLSEKKEKENITCVIPVHLYGLMCDMTSIAKICSQWDIQIVEDASQSHLAEHKGFQSGKLSNFATYSFYPGKNLGAFGDAGAVVSQYEDFIKTVHSLLNHGRYKEKYTHQMIGTNSRMDSIQAGVLSIKLEALKEQTAKRIERAYYYKKKLSNTNMQFQFVPDHHYHVYHLLTALLPEGVDRSDFLTKMKEAEISCGVHYPIPLHHQPALKQFSMESFPVCEDQCRRTISLPLWPDITVEQIDYVCEKLTTILV